MNTQNVILAAKANSGKSTSNVWVRLHKRRQLKQDVLHKCIQGNAPRFHPQKRMR